MAATILDTRDQVDTEALALEMASARKVTRQLRKATARLIALALAEAAKAKLTADGQLTPAQQQAARTTLDAAIGALSVDVAAQTAAAVAAGIALALRQEKTLLPQLDLTPADVRAALDDPVLTDAGPATAQVLEDAIGAVAQAAAGPLDTAAGLEAVAAKAGSVVPKVERQVRYLTNRSINQTTVQIVMLAPTQPPITDAVPPAARVPMGVEPEDEIPPGPAQPPISMNNRSPLVDNGLRVVWVAERDACLVCLALSGHVIDPNTGAGFDEEATFGKPGSAPSVWPLGMPLMSPPRHPNCRCRLRVISATQTMVPAALRREAERTVARGWSNHASRVSRLSAADRLVAAPNRLPMTVNERARRDVGRGEFSTRHRPRTSLRVG